MIANPIYDIVFKYLMDDDKAARFIVSRILGKEVLSLVPRPQEVVGHLAQKSLTVYRLDFAATLRLEDGSEKLILIEIQKAKYHTDILRFRRYLGEQYADPANSRVVGEDGLGREIQEPLPLVSIYFLGHRLETLTNPVIAVERNYRDAITGEILLARDSFVEGLTHDSFVIQIPYLTQRRRSDLETLLSIFDQANRSSDSHILNVLPEQFPEKFQSVIRRLQMAHSEPEVVTVMRLEDDVLEELQENERALERQKARVAEKEILIAEGEKAIERQRARVAEKEQVILKMDETILAKDQVLAEKDQALAEKDQALVEKNQALDRAKAALRATGMSEPEIDALLGPAFS